MPLSRILAGLALALLAGTAMAQSGTSESFNRRCQTLRALQEGGLIIFFRHGQTWFDTEDQDPKTMNLAHCHLQRNLSPTGIHESIEIGYALKKLDIPIGRVFASPFCRTYETARYIAGHAVQDRDLVQTAPVSGLLRRLTQKPEAGTNTVIVAHNTPIMQLIPDRLEEGDAFIIRPLEGSNFELVDSISSNGWGALYRSTHGYQQDQCP